MPLTEEVRWVFVSHRDSDHNGNVYDSPVTQGLFDRSTGAMWAVDAFAHPVPTVDPPGFAADLP
jgi:hypothetical protein